MKKIYLGMLGLHTLYGYVILFQEIGVTDLVFLSHSYVTPLSCELGLFCKFFHRGGSLTFWGGLLSLTLFKSPRLLVFCILIYKALCRGLSNVVC